MQFDKMLDMVYQNAKRLNIDDSSKIILLSDCHRGDGTWADDYSKNQNLVFAALSHYNKEKYIYIELGDGDELWKNRKISDIVEEHSDVFWLLTQFYAEGRLYMIYGNHDMVKKQKAPDFFTFYDERCRKNKVILKNLPIHEAMLLNYQPARGEILLLHGHQGDCINDKYWKLGRFLVRHLWKPLELRGVNDPTSAAKNYDKMEKAEKKLIGWAKGQKKLILIAGHTHRPVFPEPEEPPYFNDGSCVHPRCITGIEINCGKICLVKWTKMTKDDGTLFVGREILAGPAPLSDYLGGKSKILNKTC